MYAGDFFCEFYLLFSARLVVIIIKILGGSAAPSIALLISHI